MTTVQKSLFDGALKLPRKMKVKLAEELITSLDDDDPELEEAILQGAKIADRRLRDMRLGKSRKVTEEEVEKLPRLA